MTEIVENSACQTAKTVLQQAILELANWANAELPNHWTPNETNLDAVNRAKTLLGWTLEAKIGSLKVLFNRVVLRENSSSEPCQYWKPGAIADEKPSVPYPVLDEPQESDFENLKQSIRNELKNLKHEDLDNLPLLALFLEKFGSFISFTKPDVALIDIARSTAAVASALADCPNANHIQLVAGDLSGIQNFIYTISSDGALKSLRARSFYLELVTEEVVQRLLEALQLPRTSVVYAGGGNLYLLAPARKSTQEQIDQVRREINQTLLKEFQAKVFLGLDSHEFNIEAIRSQAFSESWSNAVKKLSKRKSKKFDVMLDLILAEHETYEPCKVCHRDDVKFLKPLKRYELNSIQVCGTCRRMFSLGGQLLKVKAIVRSHRKKIPGSCLGRLKFEDVRYHFLDRYPDRHQLENHETCFLINNWSIQSYTRNPTIPLLLGNYAKESENEPGIMSAREMVKKAQGIPRVGYLRMDVDRLGRIFAKGLGEYQNLARIAGLSRQMSYYFKVYLNDLAENRYRNLPQNCQKLTESDRQNLLFIYAGGDDLFVSGAWNEVIEFAFDVYQSFRCYTGNNPDISLSGGVAMAGAKFPLYQAADLSGHAEESAKSNGRDSFGAFNCVFKWSEWLGIVSEQTIDRELKKYLRPEAIPELMGILPFVRQLHNPDRSEPVSNYSRSFIRNLLITAQLQEKAIDDAKQKTESFKKDLRYFLHLPRVAYTLARLPSRLRDSDEFRPVRTSLKSPYNAPYFRAIATWLECLNRTSANKDEID